MIPTFEQAEQVYPIEEVFRIKRPNFNNFRTNCIDLIQNLFPKRNNVQIYYKNNINFFLNSKSSPRNGRAI